MFVQVSSLAETSKPRGVFSLFIASMLVCSFGLSLGLGASQSGALPRAIWSSPNLNQPGPLSRDGRYMSYIDPLTGDLGIHDFMSNVSRHLTNTGGWSTTMEGSASNSALSPDGRQVAYSWINTKTGIYEVRILPLEGSSDPRVMPQARGLHYVEVAGWMPDQKRLVLVHMYEDRTALLVMLSIDDGTVRTLKSFGHYYPRRVSLSADGRYVASDIVAREGKLTRNVFVLATDVAEAARVLEGTADDSAPVWSPDGSQLVFLSDRTGNEALWTIAIKDGAPTGEPQLLRRDVEKVTPLGISRDGTLYYFKGGPLRNVWTATLDSSLKLSEPPRRASDRFPDTTASSSWSPDGRSLAYYTVRGDEVGTMSLVIRSVETGAEREVPLQVRTGSAGDSAPPRWFPDNRSVLIAARDEESSPPKTGYYRVDIASGRTELLQRSNTTDYLARNPSLSPDGRVLYFMENANLLRTDLESGQTTNLREWLGRKNIRSAILSPDGSLIAYLSLGPATSGALEVLPSAGGPAREVVRMMPWFGVSTYSSLGWTPDGRHLLFAWSALGESSDTELYQVALAGGQPEKVGFTLKGRLLNPNVHPDGRRLTYSTDVQSTNEIWKVENVLSTIETP